MEEGEGGTRWEEGEGRSWEGEGGVQSFARVICAIAFCHQKNVHIPPVGKFGQYSMFSE